MRTLHLLLLLLAVILPGCFSYTPTNFQVLDVESGKPIPNATVSISYTVEGLGDPSPNSARGTSDANGRVTLPMAILPPTLLPSPNITLSAPGYVEGYGWLNHHPISSSQLAWQTTTQPVAEHKLWMYKDIPQRYEIAVPPGYHGLLHVRGSGNHKATASLRNGERIISLPADVDGDVRYSHGMVVTELPPNLDGTINYANARLLKNIKPNALSAAYTDGTPIPTATPATPSDAIALRYVRYIPSQPASRPTDRTIPAEHLYVIGSDADRQNALRN